MVPSLLAICIRALIPVPDQIHLLPVRLPLRHPHLLAGLIQDPANVDPRLWAVLVQIFDRLPPFLAAHTLPLAHPHLPLLQAIPATPVFSLITLLTCAHLTDANVRLLAGLHSLAALDASNSVISSQALRTLAASLQPGSGPWSIRVLSLRNCVLVADDVFSHLARFPLLSVIDLRGTRCLSDPSLSFQPSSINDLYHPASLETALSFLNDLQPNLFSSSNPYILNLHHKPSKPLPRAPAVAPQDAFVVIPSGPSRIMVGNTNILEKQLQETQDAIKHEQNKAEWYQRQERIESRNAHQSVDFINQNSPNHHLPLPPSKGATSLARSSWIGNHPPPKPSHRTSLGTCPPPRDLPVHPTSVSIRLHSTLGAEEIRPAPRKPPVAADQFYQPLVRPPRVSNHDRKQRRLRDPRIESSTLQAAPISSVHPLTLYRPPPPWDALEAAQATLHRASQLRDSTRLAHSSGQLAVVDMTSARASAAKRMLDTVAAEVHAAKRCKPAPEELRRSELHRRSSSVLVPIQPPQLPSKNPFRKSLIKQQPPNIKPMMPISAVEPPILSPSMRKEALEREAAEVKKQKPKATSSSAAFDWKSWSKTT